MATRRKLFRSARTASRAERVRMPTLSVGVINSIVRPPFQAAAGLLAGETPRGSAAAGRIARPTSGVTLIEMMIVVTLLAGSAGFSDPSATGGLGGLRHWAGRGASAGYT